MYESINKAQIAAEPLNKTIDDATYKQVWKVAYVFAEAEKNQFPLIDINTLARRLRASLYSYYGDLGRSLSKCEASDFIDNREDCPVEILNRVIYQENLH